MKSIAIVVALTALTAMLFSLPKGEECIGSWASPLAGRTSAQRHNAIRAAERLDGAVIRPGEVFSFNRRVGSCSRDQGFLRAPVSFNGQLVITWGGGVCQTSTTLYNAALLGGMEVVERHPHRFAPTYVPPGRDAAVAYDSFDLKFRNPYDVPVRVRCSVEGGQLVVRLCAAGAQKPEVRVWQDVRHTAQPITLTIGSGGRHSRLRTQGAPGFDVVVHRSIDGREEVVSSNRYPALNTIVERLE
jgi:vancomycin resistance protein VanW